MNFRSFVKWRKSGERIIKERLPRTASEPRVIRQDTFIPPTFQIPVPIGSGLAFRLPPEARAQFCRIVLKSLRF